MGRAVFDACNSSIHDNGIIIAKAANVIRRLIFSIEVGFNGDLSQAKQTASLPNQLLQMMTLSLGFNVEDSDLQRFTHIATNLASTIQFCEV